MARLRPKFDFSPVDPTYGDGQTHTEDRYRINALRPELFNEYERVLVETCDVIGDYTFGDTIPYAPSNVGGALRFAYQLLKTDIDTLFDIKFDKAGGIVTGNTTFQQDLEVLIDFSCGGDGDVGGDLDVGVDLDVGQDLSVGRDAFIDRNLEVLGTGDVTGDFTVGTTKLVVDTTGSMVGIGCAPTLAALQVNGNIFPHIDGSALGQAGVTPYRWSLYGLIIDTYSLYVDTDLIYATGGTSAIGFLTNSPNFNFDFNGTIRIRDGSMLTLGGVGALDYAAQTYAYISGSDYFYDHIMNANIDEGVFYRWLNGAGASLAIVWQSTSDAPTMAAALNGRFISGKVYNAVYNDIAETVPSDGSTEYGDLLMVDLTSEEFRVTKYDGININAFVGIRSTDPGYVVGWNSEYQNPVFVALKGMVPLKAPNARERFKMGDRLILSGSTVEVLKKNMKYMDPHRTRTLGTVVGIGADYVKLFI